MTRQSPASNSWTKIDTQLHASLFPNYLGTVERAHAAGTIQVGVFSVFRPDGWMQVAKIEGLPKQQCSEHSRIWVHAEHILWAPVAKEK